MPPVLRPAWLLALLTMTTLSLACAAPADLPDISESPGGAYEGELAPDGAGGFLAVWHDSRDGHAELYSRRLDSDGRAAGPVLRLTRGTTDAYEPSVASAGDGRLAIGWYEKTSGGALSPHLGVWDRNGLLQWQRVLAESGRNVVVATDGARLFSAWIQDEGGNEASIWARWWRPDGAPASDVLRVTRASRTTWNLNAYVPGGEDAWLAFDAAVDEGGIEEVFLVRVSTSGAHAPVQATGSDGYRSKYPDVEVHDDRLAITWFDERDGNQEVYLAVVSASVAGDLEAAARRVTTTPGASFGAYLAWNGRRLGLAWCDDSNGASEVVFQDFDGDGRPLQPARVVTDTRRSSLIPAIRPSGSGFLLLWNEAELPEQVEGHVGSVPSFLTTERIR